MHAAPSSRRGFVGAGAVVRCAAAALGSAAGVGIAIPVAVALVAWLVAGPGKKLFNEIIEDGLEDVSGVAAAVASIGLAIMAAVVVMTLIVALVAPMFVVLPLVCSAVALRLARAGLILRSTMLSLGAMLALALATDVVLDALDLRGDWWILVVLVAGAHVIGRLVVEIWEPARAGVPTPVVHRRRWVVLVAVWFGLLVLAIAAAFVLFATLTGEWRN